MDKVENLFEVMYKRRSIRKYVEDKTVEKDKIIMLLKAAMAAPSACNLQPWEFIIIDEKEGLNKLKDCIDSKNGRNYNAPAAFVVCGNTSYIPWEGNGELDCSAAIENILLAATALGLGAVWIGAADTEAVRALLDIPEHVAVISVIFFGYPAEEKSPRTQYTEEAIYWQKYDPQREHPERSINLRFL
jgi:nitroreductase